MLNIDKSLQQYNNPPYTPYPSRFVLNVIYGEHFDYFLFKFF